ncbi:MAG: glutamate--tRNA ligase, partial [Neisseriaceae bacterium]|nr:glutamate--tRNA ligase [Neisseriaceae bacterium]
EKELKKFWNEEAKERLLRFADQLETIPESDWNAENIHALFEPFCEQEEIKMGKLGMPLRIQVCGTGKTPSIDEVLALLGKEEVLKRIRE